MTPAPRAQACESAPPRMTGMPGSSPTRRGHRGQQATHRLGGRAHRGKEMVGQVHGIDQVTRPCPAPQVEGECRRGVVPSVAISPVSAWATRSRGWRAWLARAKGAGSCAFSHISLGPMWNAAGRWPVLAMDGGVAEAFAEGGRLRRGPVVAVDQAGTDWLPPRIHQADRRALAGEAYGQHPWRDPSRCTRSASAPREAERHARGSCSAQPGWLDVVG